MDMIVGEPVARNPAVLVGALGKDARGIHQPRAAVQALTLDLADEVVDAGIGAELEGVPIARQGKFAPRLRERRTAITGWARL